MKLSKQLKQEFERAVRARVEAMLNEQVEAVAEQTVKAIVNGSSAHKKASHPILYPPSTVLRRGQREGLKAFRMTQRSGLMVNAAWEALAREGHFASKATRADLTAYLMKSFEGVSAAQVSASLSQALKRGVLTAG